MSDHLARGQLLRHQGRHSEAEACLRQAIAAEPDDVTAYTELAQCLVEQEGRKLDALDTIDRAIALVPDDAYVHARRGLILTRLDRDKEALEAANRAIGLDPEFSTGLANWLKSIPDLMNTRKQLANATTAAPVEGLKLDSLWLTVNAPKK